METCQTENLKSKFKTYLNQCFEGGFIVDDQNRQPLKQFFEIFESSKLGTLVIGSVGTGKTLTFEALQRILNPKDSRRYQTEVCSDIAWDYDRLGAEILEYYRSKQNYFFDDLGSEVNGKHFGKDCNVMEELISIRYNLFRNFGTITHFTSNLTADQLRARYGERCYSRLKEMCGVVIITGTDKRNLKNFKGWIPILHERIFTEEERKWYEGYQKLKSTRQNMTIEELEQEREAELREWRNKQWGRNIEPTIETETPSQLSTFTEQLNINQND